MTRTAAQRRERFLPYRYARAGIELRITGCKLDGKDAVEPDRDSRLLELDVAWRTATVALEMSVPSETCKRVLPDGGSHDDVEILLALRCPDTFLRLGTRVAVDELDQLLTTELVLRRDDLAGAAELHAYLVRRNPGHRRRGYAHVQAARLADARTWELRIDRVREQRGEYLDIRYRRFSEDDAIAARDRRNLYLLELDIDAPILWINADHERIAGILDSKGNVGRQARLREVFFDQITHGVWTQLFLRAARHHVEQQETVYAWEEAVLDLILRDCYPEVRSAAERRDRLTDEWDDFPLVLQRLDAGLQRRDDVSAHLTKLVEQEDSV